LIICGFVSRSPCLLSSLVSDIQNKMLYVCSMYLGTETQLTTPAEPNFCWQGNSLSAYPEIRCFLLNPKFLYRVHKTPSQNIILSQINPVYSLIP
jgi:hypothetical protein